MVDTTSGPMVEGTLQSTGMTRRVNSASGNTAVEVIGCWSNNRHALLSRVWRRVYSRYVMYGALHCLVVLSLPAPNLTTQGKPKSIRPVSTTTATSFLYTADVNPVAHR